MIRPLVTYRSFSDTGSVLFSPLIIIDNYLQKQHSYDVTSIGNHMILSAIWNNKHESTNNTYRIAPARRASTMYSLWSLKRFTSAYLFQIVREKSCDYALIISMKKIRGS